MASSSSPPRRTSTAAHLLEAADAWPDDEGQGQGAHDAEHARNSRVVKKMTPPQKGSQRWLRRFGKALVCVRYREDTNHNVRFTTVELVVDTRTVVVQPHTLVLVPIPFGNKTIRHQAISLGAKWKRRDKAWLMTREAAQELGLLEAQEPVETST